MHKKRPNSLNITTLSKKLSWLLRHGAAAEGVSIQANGFIKVHDILQHANYKEYYSLEILQKVVENDKKQRFTLRYNEEFGGYEIRANQGHSLKEVEDDKCLKEILTLKEVPLAVHGTYMKHWPAIKRDGLKKMSRNHVHFAVSDAKKDDISGFRTDCEILIYLNVEKVLDSTELKLYRSENNVILCCGNENGLVPTKYFKKVVHRRTGKLLDF